jgi:hypothetical protein
LGSEGESDESRYLVRIRARIRRHPGPSSWTSLKNGFTGLMLTVSDDSIVVYAPGLPVRLARRFRVDYELHAPEVSLSTARVGWMGTQLFARECLVLRWSNEGSVTELAVWPESGDLGRLERALAEAGVQRQPVT